MSELFPQMDDRPEKGMPFAIFAYWGFCFLIVPMLMPVIGYGLWNDLTVASWIQFGYHLLNGAISAMMLREYLTDSFWNVELNPARFFKVCACALGAMLCVVGLFHTYFGPWITDCYPIGEMIVSVSPGVMIDALPVWGTLCHVLLTPITVACVFYAVGFAPFCCRKTWLGYLVISLLLLLPSIGDTLWRGDVLFVLFAYVLRLPIHLLACWSYQKANTVWAPVATLAVFNLLTSLLCMLW